MSVYKRGKFWSYKFKFAGRTYRESTKTTSLKVARAAELKRRHSLEESYNGVVTERPKPKMFSVAATEWLEVKKPALAPKSYGVEVNSLLHLKPYFASHLLSDITAPMIAKYAAHRRAEGAADKSIKLEFGTLRGMLRRDRLWDRVKQHEELLPKLAERDDVGRAISPDEQLKLLRLCGNSRSRSLYPAVALALNTGMRESEIRLLRWRQVDIDARMLTVGKSKTAAGTGRHIPLNEDATAALRFWANQFPKRQPEHCVFPSEHYGMTGAKKNHAKTLDPTAPLGSWKTAWTNARELSAVSCRFHDLRHTAITRMLEGGVPLAVVASLMGWSPSTTTKMSRRYGHIGNDAHREAVAVLDRKPGKQGGTEGGTETQTTETPTAATA